MLLGAIIALYFPPDLQRIPSHPLHAHLALLATQGKSIYLEGPELSAAPVKAEVQEFPRCMYV